MGYSKLREVLLWVLVLGGGGFMLATNHVQNKMIGELAAFRTSMREWYTEDELANRDAQAKFHALESEVRSTAKSAAHRPD